MKIAFMMMMMMMMTALPFYLLAANAESCGILSIAAGYFHMCALTNKGVMCWGDSWDGRLGFPSYDDVGRRIQDMGDNLPIVDLGTEVEVVKIYQCAERSCAILSNGKIKMWGDNTEGALGLGDTNDRGDHSSEMGDNLTTIDLASSAAIQVCSGYSHSCALLDDGSVKCWGSNGAGELGFGLTNIGDNPGEMGNHLPKVNLGTRVKAISISCGCESTCALLNDSTVKCWGTSTFGTLGQGSWNGIGVNGTGMGDSLPAIRLGINSTVKQISNACYSVCTLLHSGKVKCWGRNSYGTLGMGDTTSRGTSFSHMGDSLPHVDLGSEEIESVMCGDLHCCALFVSKKIKCWGQNLYGGLGQEHRGTIGDGSDEMGLNLPYVNLGENLSVESLSLGNGFTCALLDNKKLKCWGDNDYGNLGIGSSSSLGSSASSMGDYLPYAMLAVDFSQTGYTDCSNIACPAGKTSDSTVNFSRCYDCPNDSYSTVASICEKCPEGYQSTEDRSMCEICRFGKYSDDSIDCYDCDSGYYSNETGLSKCHKCPDTSSNSPGSSTCECCEAGRFESAGICTDCEPGRYSTPCSSMCNVCDAGTWSSALDSVCANCSSGTYSVEEGATSSSTCQRCPDSALCQEGSSRWYLTSGIWRDPDDPFVLSICIPEESCAYTGYGETECADGYEGERCGQCSPNFYRQGEYCIECGSNFLTAVLIIVLFILLISITYFAVTDTNFKHIRRSLGILIISFQIIAGFSTFSIHWPPEMTSFFNVLSVSNMNVDLIGMECALSMDYWMKWKLLQFAPLYIAAAFVVFLLILVLAFKAPFNAITRRKIFNAYGVVILSLYTSLVQKSVEPLVCIEIDDFETFVIARNPMLSCSSYEYESHMPYVLSSVVFYCILLPTILILFLFFNRKRFKDLMYNERYSCLTDPYRTEFFFWEIVIILKRIILVLLVEFTSSSVINAFCGSVCLSFYGIFNMRYNPRKGEYGNYFDSLWTIISSTILSSVVLHEYGLSSIESKVVSYAIISLVVFAFFQFVYKMFKSCLRARQFTNNNGQYTMDTVKES